MDIEKTNRIKIRMQQILLLDNYDSFTYNLFHLIEKFFDGKTDVYRNDEITIPEVEKYDCIVLSPGPKLPKDAGVMMDIIHHYHTSKPIIGICLGMQGIAEYFGSTLEKLDFPEHGQSKTMKIIQYSEIFEGLPSEFNVGRYHSWGVKLHHLHETLNPLSIDENNWVMSFKHKNYEIYGLQYHPESILTEYRETVMKNLVKIIVSGNQLKQKI